MAWHTSQSFPLPLKAQSQVCTQTPKLRNFLQWLFHIVEFIRLAQLVSTGYSALQKYSLPFNFYTFHHITMHSQGDFMKDQNKVVNNCEV